MSNQDYRSTAMPNEQARDAQKRQADIDWIPTHVHKFVIPVEWKTYEPGGSRNPDFMATLVTKLRCECGKETTRE